MTKRSFAAPDSREQLRRSFRPAEVRILFIGESAPASGRFFYQADSGLYRAVRDAFHAVDSTIDDGNFLARFQGFGCYLIDLCERPVDDLKPAERRAFCCAGEPELTECLRELHPPVVVVLLKSIQANVARSIRAANWTGQLVEVPYPGRWKKNRDAFLKAFVPVLTRITQSV